MNRTSSIIGICLGLIALGVGLVGIDFDQVTIPWYSLALIVGGSLGIILCLIGGFLIKYSIKWGLPNGDIKVEFYLPWWKKLLLLFRSPYLGNIIAEVRYRYDGEKGWLLTALTNWKMEVGFEKPNVIGFETNIQSPTVKIISIWEWGVQDNKFAVDTNKTRLPDEFDFNIRLVRATDKKCIKEYNSSYTKG